MNNNSKPLSAIFLTTVIVMLGSVATPFAESMPHSFVITPTSGPFPLTVGMTGEIHRPRSGGDRISIHWGDGTTYTWVTWWGGEHIINIDTTHVYICPGAYTVVREFQPADEPEPTFVDSSTVITVGPTLTALVALYDKGAMTCRILIGADVNLAALDRPTVAWGDGTPAQKITWIAAGGQPTMYFFETPPHTYSAADDYTVRITHEYAAPCGLFSPVSSITVQIPGPFDPTEQSTWGQIKSLYIR